MPAPIKRRLNNKHQTPLSTNKGIWIITGKAEKINRQGTKKK